MFVEVWVVGVHFIHRQPTFCPSLLAFTTGYLLASYLRPSLSHIFLASKMMLGGGVWEANFCRAFPTLSGGGVIFSVFAMDTIHFHIGVPRIILSSAIAASCFFEIL